MHLVADKWTHWFWITFVVQLVVAAGFPRAADNDGSGTKSIILPHTPTRDDSSDGLPVVVITPSSVISSEYSITHPPLAVTTPKFEVSTAANISISHSVSVVSVKFSSSDENEVGVLADPSLVSAEAGHEAQARSNEPAVGKVPHEPPFAASSSKEPLKETHVPLFHLARDSTESSLIELSSIEAVTNDLVSAVVPTSPRPLTLSEKLGVTKPQRESQTSGEEEEGGPSRLPLLGGTSRQSLPSSTERMEADWKGNHITSDRDPKSLLIPPPESKEEEANLVPHKRATEMSTSTTVDHSSVPPTTTTAKPLDLLHPVILRLSHNQSYSLTSLSDPKQIFEFVSPNQRETPEPSKEPPTQPTTPKSVPHPPGTDHLEHHIRHFAIPKSSIDLDVRSLLEEYNITDLDEDDDYATSFQYAQGRSLDMGPELDPDTGEDMEYSEFDRDESDELLKIYDRVRAEEAAEGAETKNSLQDEPKPAEVTPNRPSVLEETVLGVQMVGPESESQSSNASIVVGIAVGATVFLLLGIAGLSLYVYHERFVNKPQTLEDCGSDSGEYRPDSVGRVSQIECIGLDLPKDNFNEEMYSLDNDSFLNSLETMNAPSSWSDVRHDSDV